MKSKDWFLSNAVDSLLHERANRLRGTDSESEAPEVDEVFLARVEQAIDEADGELRLLPQPSETKRSPFAPSLVAGLATAAVIAVACLIAFSQVHDGQQQISQVEKPITIEIVSSSQASEPAVRTAAVALPPETDAPHRYLASKWQEDLQHGEWKPIGVNSQVDALPLTASAAGAARFDSLLEEGIDHSSSAAKEALADLPFAEILNQFSWSLDEAVKGDDASVLVELSDSPNPEETSRAYLRVVVEADAETLGGSLGNGDPLRMTLAFNEKNVLGYRVVGTTFSPETGEDALVQPSAEPAGIDDQPRLGGKRQMSLLLEVALTEASEGLRDTDSIVSVTLQTGNGSLSSVLAEAKARHWRMASDDQQYSVWLGKIFDELKSAAPEGLDEMIVGLDQAAEKHPDAPERSKRVALADRLAAAFR